MKPELGAIFNGKYHSKYKCSFPESIVEYKNLLKNPSLSTNFLTHHHAIIWQSSPVNDDLIVVNLLHASKYQGIHKLCTSQQI